MKQKEYIAVFKSKESMKKTTKTDRDTNFFSLRWSFCKTNKDHL